MGPNCPRNTARRCLGDTDVRRKRIEVRLVNPAVVAGQVREPARLPLDTKITQQLRVSFDFLVGPN